MYTVFSRIAPVFYTSPLDDKHYVIADGKWFEVPEPLNASKVEWIKNQNIKDEVKLITNE